MVAFYISVVIVAEVLHSLWLVLRLKPRRLKVKAHVTKWASFELEMTEPERHKSSSLATSAADE